MFEAEDSGLSKSRTEDTAQGHKAGLNAIHTTTEVNALNTVKRMVSKGSDIKSICNSLGIEVSATASSTFTLLDGEEMEFDYIELHGADEIREKTYIHPANKRQQNLLNEDSMSDIYSTIKTAGQFLPGIACVDEAGKIAVLDSSRRRMSCILTNGTYKLFVSKYPISIEDARFIAEVTHRRLEISPREMGQQLLEKYPDITPYEIADREGLNRKRVWTVVNAAKCSDDFCKIIVAYQTMSQSAVIKLNELFNSMSEKNSDFEGYWKPLIESVNGDFSRSIYDLHQAETKLDKNDKYAKLCNSYIKSIREIVDGVVGVSETAGKVSNSFAPVFGGKNSNAVKKKDTAKDYQFKLSKKHLTESDVKKVEEFIETLLNKKEA